MAQMERLLSNLYNEDVNFIGLAEGKIVLDTIKNHRLLPMRDKYNKLSIIFLTPCALFYNTLKVLLLILRHHPKGLISTGPGSVIFPAILCKMLHKKVVYIETNSRFNIKSFTGKIMYYLANKFYVQNSELLTLYPNAIYAGKIWKF